MFDVDSIKKRIDILTKEIMQKNADINFLIGSKNELELLLKGLENHDPLCEQENSVGGTI